MYSDVWTSLRSPLYSLILLLSCFCLVSCFMGYMYKSEILRPERRHGRRAGACVRQCQVIWPACPVQFRHCVRTWTAARPGTSLASTAFSPLLRFPRPKCDCSGARPSLPRGSSDGWCGGGQFRLYSGTSVEARVEHHYIKQGHQRGK